MPSVALLNKLRARWLAREAVKEEAAAAAGSEEEESKMQAIPKDEAMAAEAETEGGPTPTPAAPAKKKRKRKARPSSVKTNEKKAKWPWAKLLARKSGRAMLAKRKRRRIKEQRTKREE